MSTSNVSNQNKPLNILWITSDQQHFSALGSVNPKIKTPNLDRLAKEGTRFDRAYCNNPTCTPSRSTLITGLYPSIHGAWSLGTKLDENRQTVGDIFHENGYSTSLIGKAHFQPLASTQDQQSIERQPTLRDLDFWRDFNQTHTPWYGFDHVEITRNHADESHAGSHYGIWLEEHGVKDWQQYFRRNFPPQKIIHRQHKWDLPADLHYTTWTAEQTMARIEDDVKADKPFFCWSSFHDPHPPYLVPEPWDTMYDPEDMEPGELTPGELKKMPPQVGMTQDENADWSIYEESGFANHGHHYHLKDEKLLKKNMAVYYGMVSFMDEQIGRILDKLDELGQTDNTLIIFTTDHGHYLGQHGLTAKVVALYEDMIRLPFLARWPGQIPAGQVSSALQGLIDMPVTSLAAAGIDVPLDMQGVDQTSVWKAGNNATKENSTRRDNVICEFRHQPTKVHMRSYIDDRYKLTVYRDQDYGELFDLEKDPKEVNNLWDSSEHQSLKCQLMTKAVNSELQRETSKYPRISGA